MNAARSNVAALASALVAALAGSGIGCSPAPTSDTSPPTTRMPRETIATADDPIEPIPRGSRLDPRKVELGRRLFADKRLSRDGKRACTTCHNLTRGGVVPGQARSSHPSKAPGPYNVPTVFNVAFDFRYNWNGEYRTLEAHLTAPLMSPVVMNAGGWTALVARLSPHYTRAFFAAGYRDGVTRRAVESAIATYQRSLTTPDAKFDRYLRGETQLSERERAGYEMFKTIGCISCHQGINVGGNLFQRFGVMADALDGRRPSRLDLGRFLVTGKSGDLRVFRVPSLRNVALTAPYFHDGSASTLADAVRHMGRVQLGYVLDESEVQSIVAFLRTLTGRQPGQPTSAAR